MDLHDIETFLTIVSTKSITKTSEILFLAQPTVSHRLKALENELGFELVIRNKGHKTIDLTPKGNEFVPIAERWISLWKETLALKQNRGTMLLSVGCTDSMNISLMAPFYRKLVKEDSGLDLIIQTHSSPELYGMLDSHDIDIGFVYYHLHYKNILTEKIYEEKLFLVQSDKPAVEKPSVSTSELNPDRELFLKWDDGYQLWHDRWFLGAARSRINVDTVTLLNQIWTDPVSWLIAPESVVSELAQYRPLYVSELKNAPPNRVCYKIKHRYPNLIKEKAVTFFEEYLGDYLKTAHRKPKIGKVYGGFAIKQQPV